MSVDNWLFEERLSGSMGDQRNPDVKTPVVNKANPLLVRTYEEAEEDQ